MTLGHKPRKFKMKLGQKQRKFSLMVAKLIQYIYDYDGTYEVALGHAFRCNDCKVGAKKSFHKKCLAIDLNLFKNGEYLTKTEHHEPFGLYWESIGGTWGGRFQDGNHYSYGE